MNDGLILLIEDNRDDEDLTLRAFKKNNLKNEVKVARDGADALDFLFGQGAYKDRDMSVTPQLILLDLKLPKVDGLEVLREIKGNPQTRAIPVVVLTSSKQEKDMVESYRLGVNSYVQKPVDFERFRQAINALGMYWLLINQTPPAKAFEGDRV